MAKLKRNMPCGCIVALDYDETMTVVYCPKHKAAPDMYEALKEVSIRRERPCLGSLCRLYEGEPNSICFTEGFLSGCSPELKARLQAIEQALAKAEGGINA